MVTLWFGSSDLRQRLAHFPFFNSETITKLFNKKKKKKKAVTQLRSIRGGLGWWNGIGLEKGVLNIAYNS